jgi:hypothetical protein
VQASAPVIPERPQLLASSPPWPMFGETGNP